MVYYHFFDTPDYKDGYKKVWWATKYGLAFSGPYTFYDIISVSKPVTIRQLYTRVFLLLLPFPFITASGAASIFTVANLRGKKDDWINYVAGGMTSGLVLGIRTHSALYGIYSGILFSALAVVAKQADKYNFKFLSYDPSLSTMQKGFLKPYAGVDATFGFKREDPGRLPLDL